MFSFGQAVTNYDFKSEMKHIVIELSGTLEQSIELMEELSKRITAFTRLTTVELNGRNFEMYSYNNKKTEDLARIDKLAKAVDMLASANLNIKFVTTGSSFNFSKKLWGYCLADILEVCSESKTLY